MSFLKAVLPLFLAFFCFLSSGKVFRSPYVMFEIGDSWLCKSFGVNWVCHHYLDSKARPAFIFTTARLAAEGEKLDFSEFELNEPALNRPRKVSINKHIWIDSFHENSFYENVLSRYERTICCENFPEKFQILIGFHSFKKNYPKYSRAFLKAIRSLRLFTSNLEEIKRLLKQEKTERQAMDNYVQNILFEREFESKPAKKPNKKTVLFVSFFFFLFSLLLGGVFYKQKRKKTSLKKRQKRRK